MPVPPVEADASTVDVVVEVGSWEHECCGPAIERGDIVDLGCQRGTDEQGRQTLTESRHEDCPEVRVRGRVRDIHVIRDGQPAEAVSRVPSGKALRGFDPDDDGHLEAPWTGEPVAPGQDFLVKVHVG